MKFITPHFRGVFFVRILNINLIDFQNRMLQQLKSEKFSYVTEFFYL